MLNNQQNFVPTFPDLVNRVIALQIAEVGGYFQTFPNELNGLHSS